MQLFESVLDTLSIRYTHRLIKGFHQGLNLLITISYITRGQLSLISSALLGLRQKEKHFRSLHLQMCFGVGEYLTAEFRPCREALQIPGQQIL